MILIPFDMRNYTVESVLEGHPDKVCDQICDTILDEFLELDEDCKVAVECLGTGSSLFIGGEIFSKAKVDIESLSKNTYEQIGYEDHLTVLNRINAQSEQLRRPVLKGAAGDQGIIYGFACSKKGYNYLPSGVFVVNAIAKEIDLLRKKTKLFLPDGKVQITFRQKIVDTLIISIQHYKDTNIKELKNRVLNDAVSKIIPLSKLNRILFNHKSKFISGGFSNDTGLSGRKIINDTYCGLVPHGGGAFSGKDPSKVDRSASYMARFVSKNVVANEISKFCLVSAAYAFGEERPIMLEAKTESVKNDKKVDKLIKEKFDFRPNAIVERLNLKKVKYRQTSTYGHFFNSKYNWEQTITI